MNYETQLKYPPGTKVKVWIGAWTGSPGVPKPGDKTIDCRVDHWNSVGQAYVQKLHDVDRLTAAGNISMYVFGSAIIGVINE